MLKEQDALVLVGLMDSLIGKKIEASLGMGHFRSL
jgi:hypothetical protein